MGYNNGFIQFKIIEDDWRHLVLIRLDQFDYLCNVFVILSTQSFGNVVGFGGIHITEPGSFRDLYLYVDMIHTANANLLRSR